METAQRFQIQPDAVTVSPIRLRMLKMAGKSTIPSPDGTMLPEPECCMKFSVLRKMLFPSLQLVFSEIFDLVFHKSAI